MASSGAMADFARLPTERKVLVFVVIGAVLGALYWQFVYKSLNSRLDTARGLVASKTKSSSDLDKQLDDYIKMKEQLPDLLARNQANQKALPSEADRPELWEMLGPKIAQAGVTLAGSEDKAEAPIESFIRVPVEVTVKGNFMQLKRFFALLAQKEITAQGGSDKDNKRDADDRERIISIDTLVLNNPEVKNREVVLTARFTATTFRQVEKAPPPGKPGQAPAAGAGSGAPLPSAATPAGAKARVDDALQKHDDKVRNAQGVDEAKTPAGSGAAQLKKGVK